MTYQFEVVKNISNAINNQGQMSYTFTNADFPMPRDLPGVPATVSEFLALLDPQYYTMTWSVSPTGTVSSHDCYVTQQLFARSADRSGVSSPTTLIAQTSNSPDSGGAVNPTGNWVNMNYTGKGMPAGIEITRGASGSGSGCRFLANGGWENTRIRFKVTVNVSMLNYCTSTGSENINQEFCYNFVANQISQNGITQATSDYLKSYCSTKFGGRGLDIFTDPSVIGARDFNICACNMPDSDYNTYVQSIQTAYPELNLSLFTPQCLLPACKTSSFQNITLNNCPGPQCINIAGISGSSITGAVTINQTVDGCQNIGSVNGAPSENGGDAGGNNSGSGTGSGSNNNNNNNTAQTQSFFRRYWIPLLIGALILIILIAVILYFTFRKKTTDIDIKPEVDLSNLSDADLASLVDVMP